LDEDDDPDDPMSPRTQRVVPFVEDRRNCMVVEPCIDLSEKQLASFQAIIKKAIQGLYQLEDNELASEPLPSNENRKRILLYESAEGGAGVLRRLLENEKSFADLATEALRLCHYDANDGSDLKRAEGAAEDCEAACYDCLMSYSNQREHNLLARDSIRDLLLDLKRSVVRSSPTQDSFAVHLDKLKAKCDSNLEKTWLDFLVANGLNLPTSSQKYFEPAQTRPDFQFEHHKVMVYVDGPVHEFPDRQLRDREKTTLLDDMDYTVLRFDLQNDWLSVTKRFPHVFGAGKSATATQSLTPDNNVREALDLDLFSDEWQEVLGTLSQHADLTIESGADVQRDGRVVGAYVATIAKQGKAIYVIDASESSNSEVAAQLQSENLASIAIDPADSDAVQKILAALEST
jgi:very-short-patch-repair endonuclease